MHWFDTTVSNIGVKTSTCVLLKKKNQKKPEFCISTPHIKIYYWESF